MSGGSWNYEFGRVQDLAERLCQEPDIRRRRLGHLLHLVAKALHDIEWVDSADYGPDDDHKAIEAVFEAAGTATLAPLVEQLRADLAYVEAALEGIEP